MARRSSTSGPKTPDTPEATKPPVRKPRAPRKTAAAPPPPPVPEPEPPRKSRLGLYLPFGALAVGMVVWSLVWVQVQGTARARMDASVAQLKSAGYELSWKDRKIGGYPFRISVVLTEARLREPTGWAISTPLLETEAYIYAAGHWVMATPQGLTLTRPVGGPVEVTGDVLRASLSGLGKAFPSLSIEGRKLRFAAAPGALPFALTTAKKAELHLRPGPDDQGALLFRIDGAKATPGGLLGRVAADKPVAMIWDSIISKASSLKGSSWSDAVRTWNREGGQATVRQAGLTAGSLVLGSNSGLVSVGSDGRMRGNLDISLRNGTVGLVALAEAGVISAETAEAAATVAQARQGNGQVAQAKISFEAGRTTLGPVALGPAPKIY